MNQVDIRTFSGFPKFKKRFLSYLPSKYKEMEDQCWNWLGSKNSSTGYGRLGWGKKDRYDAHKISYLIFKGQIPLNTIVRHTCDNRICVNPNHLIIGTHYDNSVDSVKRGRQGHQKLNEECVKVIRWMVKNNFNPGLIQKLADVHNVTRQTINDIIKNRSWTWVQI